MSPKIVNFEIILIYFLLLIPWPHTQVIKLLCSRDNSRLVRKIVRSKWTPILDKYQVKLPLECPLHPFRDVFAPRQDAKKRDRPTQWTCRKCGKSFYQEKFLDLHFETRHPSIVNRDEDAVCLADYCDIMRCEVFQSEESTRLNTGDSHIITDIEVWGDSLGQNSALAKANAAYLSLIPLRSSAIGASRAAKVQQGRQLCQDKVGQTKFKDPPKDPHHVEKAEHAVRPKSSNDSSKKRAGSGGSSSSSTLAATSKAKADTKKAGGHQRKKKKKLPGATSSKNDDDEDEEDDDDEDDDEDDDDEGRAGGEGGSAEAANNGNASANGNRTLNGNGQNMQKVRANCRAEELSKLKTKCEHLVRSCIAGLLLSMTDHAFKEMEEEMNKAVCWYLSCDRYWEDGPLEPRAFPWGLIVILVFVLSTGICFCYYIIWILFDSEESTISGNHQQPYLHYPQGQQPPGGLHGGGGLPMGIGVGVHGSGPYPQHYYYQQPLQPQQQELYPELPRYDYRHSPRRYSERPQQQQQQGTPTAGGAQAHSQASAYQQDIFDRRDYTNRAMPTTSVTGSGGGGSGSGAAAGPGLGNSKASGSHMNLADVVSEANAVGLGGGLDGQRHYTPNQASHHHHHHQLEPHHRHTGASQTSLRGSASSHEIIQSDVGHNEHYIYVTYPPDLKKRFFDKYE